MAGIIAAIDNNAIDMAGIAPQSKIIPIKLFHADGNVNYYEVTHEDVAYSFKWAADNGADIISCSWRIPMTSDLVNSAVDYATTTGRSQKGAIIFAAAGNENLELFTFPGQHPSVMAIGASSPCNERKHPTSCNPYSTNGPNDWGSNFGDKLAFVAPGVKIYSIPSYQWGWLYGISNGSSASTAEASGVTALMLDINPNLTRQEVTRILALSSNRVGNYCYNWNSTHPDAPWHIEMGHGRLNAYNAVQLSRPGVTISSPVLEATATSNSQLSNNLGIIFSGQACPTSLPFGIMFVRRFEVTLNITYPSTSNPVIICTSNGFNLANPNDGRRFAEAINFTSTSATLRTYIYTGYNSNGQYLGWIPTSPSNIKFSYVVVGGPSPTTFQTESGVTIVSNDIPFNLDLDDNMLGIDRSVTLTGTTANLSPNPAKDELRWRVNSVTHTNVTIEIYNSVGVRQYFQPTRKINKGLNVISINISALPRGSYFFKAGKWTEKFIKQ